MSNPTTAKRTSDRELVVTRTFDAPAHIVFEAWSRAELFRLWWPPKSLGMRLRSCEMDVRTGGGYRIEFGEDAANTMAFFGTYTEVTPPTRMVWTNDESEDGPVTTVTFEEKDGKTLVVLHELHPSKAALDANIGAAEALPEQFGQLDDLLIARGASA